MGIINATDVIFVDTDGMIGTVQFDTQNETELAQCFWEFCIENGVITTEKTTVLDARG